VIVTDNGIGISKKDQENLFQMFFKTQERASSRLNQYSHGIGLSLCKKFAIKMGGDLYHNAYY
jgi:signal transduction histidine kinase